MILWLMPILLTLSFIIKRHTIRSEMKENLKAENLQKVVLKKSEVKWVDDHEIWVNNQLFDIKTKSSEDGVFTFTGIFDENETELMQNEKEAEEKDNENTLIRFLKLINNSYYNCLSPWHIALKINCASFPDKSSEIVSAFCEVITPPPQFV